MTSAAVMRWDLFKNSTYCKLILDCFEHSRDLQASIVQVISEKIMSQEAEHQGIEAAR